MGLVYSKITLRNPVLPDMASMEAKCLVDAGSTFLALPQHTAHQLQLKVVDEKEATITDGTSRMVPYAGPVQINFENRSCFVGALIMGDEVLLGTVPMEDMDLVVIPKLLKLSVNPENPNFARGSVK